MNVARLSTRDRRALALGAAALVVLVGVLRGLPALAHATIAARSEARALLQELASVRADLDLARRPASDSASRELATLLWPDPRPAQFMGLLTRFVADAAQRSHLHVTSLRAEAPDSTRRALPRASAFLAGECDIAGCTELLALLESASPAVRVTLLRIQAGDVSSGDDRAEHLQIEMTIEALARVGAR